MKRREKPLIVIEHLEPVLSRWILAEYRHAARLAHGRLVFTNAGRCCKELSMIAPCYEKSIVELEGTLYTSRSNVIILDPQAEKLLDPQEAANAEAIVIGGILGDHPPRGRTRELLTRRASGMKARSLGPHQFSIDGAVYAAVKTLEGVAPDRLEVVLNPVVSIDLGDLGVIEVELPYAYPKVNGEPLMAPELRELLAAGLALEELREIKGQGLPSCWQLLPTNGATAPSQG
ncbi:SAM-dependent methyltransferase [Hyperthermus butylicus]|uniref:Conserved archaeal protein n=1 Tax=Hyperthermus butylicus (strain DSM 5456 / JCM 9403 / PLM1-5) TaxID=415426 RepID=A2BLT9_HYPBU|nr:SAM-dependent methyltransferase [Hyperthermus butylicus]ABM80950.1 conserved archaeal protein [Hyperthermus butylicus DSM 5456]